MRVFIRDTLLFVYRKQKRDLEARRIAQFILENYPESKAAKRLRRERVE